MRNLENRKIQQIKSGISKSPFFRLMHFVKSAHPIPNAAEKSKSLPKERNPVFLFRIQNEEGLKLYHLDSLSDEFQNQVIMFDH